VSYSEPVIPKISNRKLEKIRAKQQRKAAKKAAKQK